MTLDVGRDPAKPLVAALPFTSETECLDNVPKTGRLAASGENARFILSAYRPELIAVALMFIATFSLGLIYALPVQMPGMDSLNFTGMNYTAPLATAALWGFVIYATRRQQSPFYYLFAFIAYMSVVVLHFNVKLWMGIVNSARWDEAYWQSDIALRPIVESSFGIHNWLAANIGNINQLYLFAFIAMFYFSFILHAARDSRVFRKMVFASILVHALGAFSYLLTPAIGPFIYETGVNAAELGKQAHMLSLFQAHEVEGASWVIANGADHLMAGAAAMPSLHTATSAVFLFFAWKYERWLTLIYLPLFLFIIVEAVATRWHYVVDVPAGLLLAIVCVMIAERAVDESPARGTTKTA